MARRKQVRAWVRISDRTKSLHPSKQKWEVIWTDPKRGYKQRTTGGFKRKHLAQDWADEFIGSVRSGNYIDPETQTITFREFAERWYEEHTPERLNTQRSYGRIIFGNRSLLMEAFGDTYIGDMTHARITEWIAELSSRRAPQTVRNQYYVLRAVLAYAVRCDLLLRNPALDVQNLPKQRQAGRRSQDHPLTIGQRLAVVQALPRSYDMFTRLVAFTGLRPEEAIGLRLRDVDLTNGTVKVRGVVVQFEGETHREDRTKTSKSRRTIGLNSLVMDALVEYERQHRADALRWFSEYREHTNPGEDLPLFVGVGRDGTLDYSTPLDYMRFYRTQWRKATRAAGLPDSVRFYDLRHAHISWRMAKLGQDGALSLTQIQEEAGHSSPYTTLTVYSHSPKSDFARQRDADDAAIAAELASENVTQLDSKRSG